MARRSLEHLLASGVAYEIRTTYHPALVSDEALLACARTLGAMGVHAWVLQRWRPREHTPAELTARWHWPGDTLMRAPRDAVPTVTLR